MAGSSELKTAFPLEGSKSFPFASVGASSIQTLSWNKAMNVKTSPHFSCLMNIVCEWKSYIVILFA